ncbi:hypothetical protein LEP1GSC179_0049 [Leptospira santarosai str. MOR084]|uniref:Uncharacterized protein n=1 Tax=Leptospira santarosai str. MOR084 TaxID=1049984 RepID=A0A0E2BU68_9LEPT|nr:hypothetical protein LEP1GSC179_0049 [Leptospira santarosai str. MOR084]
MPSLKEELNIALLEKHQAWHEARGMLSPSKILNANQLTANHLQCRIHTKGSNQETENRTAT